MKRYLPFFLFFTFITSLLSASPNFYTLAMDGGEIAADQVIPVGATPATITEIVPPIISGGAFQWVQSTAANPVWAEISGATSVNYSPPALNNHTLYARRVVFPGALNYETSNVVVIAVGLVLPVELIHFDATANKNGTVQLKWITLSEQDNDYFLIERSSDGINFRTVEEISGALNSTELKKYTFRDENPSHGDNYYRLKQVDTDGDFEYSVIISINIKNKSSEFSIYPNPVQDKLNIRLNAPVEKNSQISIFNSIGVLVEQIEISDDYGSIVPLDVHKLTPGTYFISIRNGRKDVILKKFIKI